MFIVSLFGGLGSQMDQYSFYLGLRKHYPDTQIKFSVCNVAKPEHNGYELKKVFGIEVDEASLNEIIRLSDIYPFGAPFPRVCQRLFNWRRNLFGYKESWITPDDPSAFYKEIFELNPLKSYMFWGNWSNEKYREGVNDEILNAFEFPEITDKENKRIYEDIVSSNSVSIHVRRGDYIKYGFPLLSLEYYKKAVEIVQSKICDAKFYIFSNDIDYIINNFGFLKNYEIVSINNKGNNYKDMQLMSSCKHNIIANSSFSYWGARLNRNSDAIIICPKYHVNVCKHTTCLPKWIILDNQKL
jgi:hypothetical protein